MADWDEYEAEEAAASASSGEKKPDLATDLMEAAAVLEAAKARYKQLCETACLMVPEEPGSFLIDTPKHIIRVSRPEKYEWDEELLERMFGGSPYPVFVMRRLSIPKNKFDALPEADQKALHPALTRKPGAATVKVEPKTTKEA